MQDSYKKQIYLKIDALYLLVHRPRATITGNERAIAIYLAEQNLDGLPIQDVLGSIENETSKICEEFTRYMHVEDTKFKMRFKQIVRGQDAARKALKTEIAKERERQDSEAKK
jgi:hypothetical protein